MEKSTCPNCISDIKSGFLSSNEIFDQHRTDFINVYHEKKSEGYCGKCGPELLLKAKSKRDKEVSAIAADMEKSLPHLPIITVHVPYKWEYDVVGMVTAQSTTGTGIIAEFAAGWTDFFGQQSGRYNSKLKAGEDLCKTQLRMQALALGANAIIGTDIDYADVGGSRDMLMVCMAGTAVKLRNLEVLDATANEHIRLLKENNARLTLLKSFDDLE